MEVLEMAQAVPRQNDDRNETHSIAYQSHQTSRLSVSNLLSNAFLSVRGCLPDESV